jgi:hypothetical protein
MDGRKSLPRSVMVFRHGSGRDILRSASQPRVYRQLVLRKRELNNIERKQSCKFVPRHAFRLSPQIPTKIRLHNSCSKLVAPGGQAPANPPHRGTRYRIVHGTLDISGLELSEALGTSPGGRAGVEDDPGGISVEMPETFPWPVLWLWCRWCEDNVNSRFSLVHIVRLVWIYRSNDTCQQGRYHDSSPFFFSCLFVVSW